MHSTPACTEPNLIEKSCRGPGGVGMCMPQLDLDQLPNCLVQVVHHRHVDTQTSSWHQHGPIPENHVPSVSSTPECEIETLRNSGFFPGPLTQSTPIPSCKQRGSSTNTRLNLNDTNLLTSISEKTNDPPTGSSLQVEILVANLAA